MPNCPLFTCFPKKSKKAINGSTLSFEITLFVLTLVAYKNSINSLVRAALTVKINPFVFAVRNTFFFLEWESNVATACFAFKRGQISTDEKGPQPGNFCYKWPQDLGWHYYTGSCKVSWPNP